MLIGNSKIVSDESDVAEMFKTALLLLSKNVVEKSLVMLPFI